MIHFNTCIIILYAPIITCQIRNLESENDIFQIDWAAPIVRQWDFGEEGAWKALELFLSEGRNNNFSQCFILQIFSDLPSFLTSCGYMLIDTYL